MKRGANKNKWTNIALLVTMFIVVAGFVVGILDFLNILTIWMRLILGIIIALIFGLIIYFKKEKRRDK